MSGIPGNPAKLVLADIQRAIYYWVKQETAGVIPQEQIIWRNQSEPLPPRPCVTMRITSGPRRTGYSDNIHYLMGDQFIIGGQRVLVVSIQVFGNMKVSRPMAYQLACDLSASLSKLTVLDKFRAAGIAVFDQGDPLNITALEETEFEERAAFDLTLGVAENVLDDPGVLERANVTSHVTGP
jgi:hypothetical protein